MWFRTLVLLIGILAAAEASAAEACQTLTCQVKLRAYDAYMQNLDAGRPKYALPQRYRDLLRAHYPGADLDRVRFAFSDRQPPDNATTDCNDIYFNSESYVAALRDDAPLSNYTWLLHELAHPEQCAAAGGRAEFAKRWWDELEAALRSSGRTIDWLQSTDQLVAQIQRLYVELHAAMPLEREADAKAEAVLDELRRCCIGEDGTLAR